MAVEKFSISLPEELMSDVDGLAEEEGITRSALIREATEAYVTARRSSKYEAARRERIGRAIEGFRQLARESGPDEKSSLEYLREVREESMAGSAEEYVRLKAEEDADG